MSCALALRSWPYTTPPSEARDLACISRGGQLQDLQIPLKTELSALRAETESLSVGTITENTNQQDVGAKLNYAEHFV